MALATRSAATSSHLNTYKATEDSKYAEQHVNSTLCAGLPRDYSLLPAFVECKYHCVCDVRSV